MIPAPISRIPLGMRVSELLDTLQSNFEQFMEKQSERPPTEIGAPEVRDSGSLAVLTPRDIDLNPGTWTRTWRSLLTRFYSVCQPAWTFDPKAASPRKSLWDPDPLPR